jgi:hypothetical protein
LDVVADTDIAEINDLITMKYVNEVFASQLEANSFINVNPGAINDGVGRAEISKKNSFSINMWLTGGLLLFGGLVAAKIISAYSGAAALLAGGEAAIAYAGNYSLAAAYWQENVLSVAWGAVRDVGLSFVDAVSSLDGLSKFAGSGFNVKDIGSFIFDWLGGSSTVIGTAAAEGISSAAALNAINSQLINSGVVGFNASISGITQTLGNIFNQPISATLSGLKIHLESLAGSAASFVFGGLSTAASALADATIGVPILSSVTAGIASSAASFATYISGAGPLIQVVAVVAAAYVAVKVVKSIWKGVKKLFSDERMKTNVKFVRKMPNGLNLYQYEYRKEFKDIAGHGVFEGYMAHEVEKRYPKAVQIESNGYKSVNYSLVGI